MEFDLDRPLNEREKAQLDKDIRRDEAYKERAKKKRAKTAAQFDSTCPLEMMKCNTRFLMRSPHRHRLIRLYVADYVTNSTKRLRLAAPPSLHTPRNASLPITETGFCGRVPLGYKGREVTRHVHCNDISCHRDDISCHRDDISCRFW